MSVYQYVDGTWRFKRWSTDQGGDVVDVLMWYDGYRSVVEAVAAIDRLPPVEPVTRSFELMPKPVDPVWRRDPERFVKAWESHPARYQLWQAYKPLTPRTIERYRLGVGVVPDPMCPHQRLILPVFDEGILMGVKGRKTVVDGADNPECEGEAKWLNASGSKASLWGVDRLADVARCEALIVAEQPIDAMLAMQETPSVVAIATPMGANTWYPDWSKRVAAAVLAARKIGRKPPPVVVWYDNDLAGAPNAETHASEAAAWRERHPGNARVPEPSGPRIVESLIREGLEDVSVYPWPKGTPVHADLGWALAKGVAPA